MTNYDNYDELGQITTNYEELRQITTIRPITTDYELGRILTNYDELRQITTNSPELPQITTSVDQEICNRKKLAKKKIRQQFLRNIQFLRGIYNFHPQSTFWYHKIPQIVTNYRELSRITENCNELQ